MGRKRRNWIYNFFEYDENAHLSKCLIDGCSVILKGKHGANLLRHFQYKHKNEFEMIQERNKKKTEFNNSTNNDILLKNVINLVTIHERPFTLLDDEAFQNIISLIPMVGTSSINAHNIRELVQRRASEALEGQADSNQRTNDASDQNEPDGQGSQLLVAKTETFDLDLDPLFETQDVSDSEYSEEMPDEASTSEVKTESRGKSCCIDTCPTHTRLLEAILSCVSRQEQSAARAANAQEQMARAQESQLRIQEALMRTQEAQTHALEKIARLLEDRPQRL